MKTSICADESSRSRRGMGFTSWDTAERFITFTTYYRYRLIQIQPLPVFGGERQSTNGMLGYDFAIRSSNAVHDVVWALRWVVSRAGSRGDTWGHRYGPALGIDDKLKSFLDQQQSMLKMNNPPPQLSLPKTTTPWLLLHGSTHRDRLHVSKEITQFLGVSAARELRHSAEGSQRLPQQITPTTMTSYNVIRIVQET